jgi:predicted  nucleic acid-binding Zn-ribbon protein
MTYSDKLQAALAAVEAQDAQFSTIGMIEPLREALNAALTELDSTVAMYEDAEQELRGSQGELEASQDELGDAQKRIGALEDELFENQTSYVIDVQIHRIKYLGLDSEHSTIELLEKMRDNAEQEEAHNANA